MNFGTIFIALIGFTIAMLLVPQFIQTTYRRNIELLRDDIRRLGQSQPGFVDGGKEASDEDRKRWDMLMHTDDDYLIRSIKGLKYVPLLSVLIVVEVCVFAVSSYKVSRGQRIPGFVEDMAIAMIVVLVLVTLYATYRVVCNNLYFNRYLRNYKKLKARFVETEGTSVSTSDEQEDAHTR